MDLPIDPPQKSVVTIVAFTVNNRMRISRNYFIEDYARLRFDKESDWCKAADIFLDRLETRYLEHISALRRRKTSGFVVLALDSALIETLEQFRRGVPETPRGKSQEYFVSFLTEPPFGDHFDAPRADLFYRTIRCGLLHQSEAKGPSRIKRGDGRPLVEYSDGREGLVIAVDKFHELLINVIYDYASVLRKPESRSQRAAFKEKMDHICRIEAKPAEKPPDQSTK
jgi:hypothetical protein